MFKWQVACISTIKFNPTIVDEERIMPTPKIMQLAKRQLADYRSNNPGTCFFDPNLSLTIKESYELQDAVTNLRVVEGEKIAGYKVGCIGPGTIKQFGMKGPIRGTLFIDEIYLNDSKLSKSKFCNLAIEGEMAFKLNNNCEIDMIFPVIELHNFTLRGNKKTLQELISNNAINAGIVLPNISDEETDPIPNHDKALSLIINGQSIGTSELWPNNGDPKTTLDWIKLNLFKYGLPLKPRQIILAGTTLGLYPVEIGDNIKVIVNDQVRVQCSII